MFSSIDTDYFEFSKPHFKTLSQSLKLLYHLVKSLARICDGRYRHLYTLLRDESSNNIGIGSKPHHRHFPVPENVKGYWMRVIFGIS